MPQYAKTQSRAPEKLTPGHHQFCFAQRMGGFHDGCLIPLELRLIKENGSVAGHHRGSHPESGGMIQAN